MTTPSRLKRARIDIKEWLPAAGNYLPKCIPCYNAPCSLFKKNLDLSTRIGSDSQDAMVFGVNIEGCPIAAKLLLPIDDQTVARNEDEIEMAKIVSNAVRQGKTDRFPIVYGATKCNKIKIDPNISELAQNAYRYRVTQYLKEKYTTKGKRFSIRNRSMPFAEFISAASQEFNDDEIKTLELKGHILMSEMAWGDGIQFLNKLGEEINLPKQRINDVFDIVIPEIFLGIIELHKLGISHNDLHLGNILIRADEFGNFRVLLHDFGKSELVQEWDSENVLRDFDKVADYIRSNFQFDNTRVKDKMLSLIDYTKEKVAQAELDGKQISNFIYHDLYEKWTGKKPIETTFN